MNYEEFKNEIVTRCKAEGACQTEFKRILNSESFTDIFTVLKDNFSWACIHKIIEAEILTAVLPEANASDIWVNVNTSTGYLFASDSATVRAWGSATVEAWGSATVRASDSATVRAWGSATVEAWGSATVRASDSATVRASDSATVRASDSATVRASDSATVRAWGSAFISSYTNIECKLSDHAIFRNTSTNEITIMEGAYTIITKTPETNS